ncbi:MAG: hypothetical protein A2133_02185, partial [Actinobacteria bacterium RBG_16_64_13]
EGIAERVLGPRGEALFALSALGRAHLVDEGPELERAGLLHQANKLRGWLELPEVIRTGRPVPKDPARADVRTLVCAMGEREPAVLDEVVEKCFAYAGTIRTMVDVGGAVGHLARQFSRRGVAAALFDRADVIPVAQEFLGDEAANIALVSGDYTASLPVGPFDLVYFGNVYHIYGAETNARVTREALAITAPGGTIAIQDYMWDRNAGAAMFAVNMLRATENGDVWTETQYRGWLSDAGYESIETFDLETTGTQLILGKAPSGL